mmetsp:Transcript_11899/g.19367  ORF Transcript_11899/g.19367 Transcript_11899/m.19367 type:complete len:131 (+) Transcript_11899:1171-1563(+)
MDQPIQQPAISDGVYKATPAVLGSAMAPQEAMPMGRNAMCQMGDCKDGAQPVYIIVPPPEMQCCEDPYLARRGFKSGGTYTNEKYCGSTTWMVALVSLIVVGLPLPLCFCPLDSREVYEEPETGRRVIIP